MSRGPVRLRTFMSSDYSRIHRLLKILTLIQAERDWTAERLATECGVSVRTIYRDMKMLEGAGIPYFYDEQSRGYQVRRDFFMPPVQLTLDESLAKYEVGVKMYGICHKLLEGAEQKVQLLLEDDEGQLQTMDASLTDEESGDKT